MKSKLKIFQEFAEGILPHEAEFLLKENRIRDEEKELILKTVCSNAEQFFGSKDYDEAIDKRKYAYIKKWIGLKLESIDVDAHLNYLSFIEKQILTDTIIPQQEQELLAQITGYNNRSFYFQKFYELVKEYQDYLLVRFRYQDVETTGIFLEKNREYYNHSISVREQLFLATKDLTRQYTNGVLNTKHWEEVLLQFLDDESLDGKNKYNAFVRLVFLYFNYKEYNKATHVFDKVDRWFREGKMYSKRVLFNYYANRVILHSNLDDLGKAEYYAHLSVKQDNSDKLFYLNNLIAILLKRDKNKEALDLLTTNYQLFKKSYNHHQKLAFATHYIRTLVRNKRFKIAETFAENFLLENRESIFEHRWRHFFSNYLMLLTTLEKHDKILRAEKKYALLEREKEELDGQHFIPKIHWYYYVAMYMNGHVNEQRLFEELIKLAQNNLNTVQAEELFTFIDRLSFAFPLVFQRIKSHLSSQAQISR